MKKLDCSLRRLVSGFAVLVLLLVVSNSCTKSLDEIVPATPGLSGLSGYRVIVQGGFNPGEIKISVGDMVTWTNDGSAIESVTSDDGLFDGIVNASETYSFKFKSPGTYTYHSRINPNLIGRVVVN